MALSDHLNAHTRLLAAQPARHAASERYVNAADAAPLLTRRQPFAASETCFNHPVTHHEDQPMRRS